VYLLTGVRLEAEPVGVAFAFANAVLFSADVVLGHRVARHGAAAGISGLAAAILIAAVLVSPVAGGRPPRRSSTRSLLPAAPGSASPRRSCPTSATSAPRPLFPAPPTP
jgi:threonine/homoserine efflux transporter RhtA